MVVQAATEFTDYWEFNDYWVDHLTDEVILAQANALDPGKFEPYLGQLQVVSSALSARFP